MAADFAKEMRGLIFMVCVYVDKIYIQIVLRVDVSFMVIENSAV